MSERVNPFANLTEPPVFTTKPRKEKPVEEEALARIAEQNNFPSRQAAKAPKVEKRKPRVYRTGRNQQFNAKATPETIQRIYKAADERHVPLGELLKQALDALDAMEGFCKQAETRKMPLKELTRQALDALERAGVPRLRAP
jgi:hypothetical protein